MIRVLIWMAVGVVLGLCVFPERWQRLNCKLQYIWIAVLIFCMGASLGGDPAFFQNLSSVGRKAALFAVLPTAFSVACVYAATKKLQRGRGRDDSSGGR